MKLIRIMLCSVVLVAFGAYGLTPGDCVENGGSKVCTLPTPTPWVYSLCESGMVAIASHGVRWCQVAGGEMINHGCRGSTPHSESNLVSRASAFAGNCPMTVDSGWNAQVRENNCYNGGPQYRNDILVRDLRSISFSGEDCGKFVVASRGRELTCPPGSTRETINHSVVCVQPYEPPSCGVGNPVLPLTGRKIQIETDLTSEAVAFSRVYSSTGWHLPYSIEGRLPPFLGQFGHYWRTKFDYRVYNLNSAEAEIGISFPNGAFQYFDSDLQPVRGDDKAGVLHRIDDTLHYRYGGKHLVFSSEGLLKEYHQSGRPGLVLRYSGHDYSGPMQSVDAQGNAMTVALPEGLLVAIENSQTQRIVFEFSYDAGGRMVVAKTPSDTVLYGYDAQDNLVSVEKEEGGTRTYVYDDPRFPNFLTGLIDESGELFALWNYDASGRAVSSEHAEGAEKFELDFTFINDASDPRVLVKNPLGKDTTYHYETIGGVRKVNRLEGHASPNCAAANKSYDYYDNGTLKSKTDWEGNVTTYLRDDWGREIARTEAAGTPGARTITTEYHSEFNKPVKITEPDLITEMTYDSAGRLLNTKKTSITVQ